MIINELVEGVSSLDESMGVYFPDGREVVAIAVKNGRVYLSDEYPAKCPECGHGFKDVDEYICDACGWTETNDYTCNECAADVDLCECDKG